MPTESNKTDPHPESALTADLVQELERVVELLRKELVPSGASAPDAIAIVRVLESISLNDWECFASTHGLENWLCFSLQQELADAVSSLLEAQERLAFQRDHDPLTGLGNRGFFNRRLESEVSRALRSNNELSLLYLDLDNFKLVNDTYGHDCGDMVLQRLGAVLRDNVRHYDVPARIGGEEFCIILPSTSCWTGVMLGNRLLDLFRRESFQSGGDSFSVTFSGGVSSLSLLDEDRKNSAELLKSADKALYDAKAGGKNTIALATSDKLSKDRASLVRAQEKQFLFSFLGSE